MFCKDREFRSFRAVSLEEKLSFKYSKSTMKFGHKEQPISYSPLDKDSELFMIDTKFIQDYSDLVYLG